MFQSPELTGAILSSLFWLTDPQMERLKAMLIVADTRDRRKHGRIGRLGTLVAAFKPAAFGRQSGKGDPYQFELALEDPEAAMAETHAVVDAGDLAARRRAKPRAANRGALPKLLRASKRSSSLIA